MRNLVAFLFLCAEISSATTHITTCGGTYSTSDVYIVDNNITTSTSDCLTFTGVNTSSTVPLEINLNGKTVSTTGSFLPLNIHDNPGSFYIHDGTLNGRYNYHGTILEVVKTAYNATQGQTFKTQNVVFTNPFPASSNNVVVSVRTSGAWTSVNDTYNTVVAFCDYNLACVFINPHMDLTPANLYFSYGIGVQDTPNSSVSGAVITGPPGVYNVSTGSYTRGLDDNVLFYCSGINPSLCTNATITNSTLKSNTDAAIETVGTWHGFSVTGNTFSDTPHGFACYYDCGFTTLYITNNTQTSTNQTDDIVDINGTGSNTFSVSSITGNTITTTAPGGLLHSFAIAGTWSSFYGVYIATNHLGSGAAVYLPSIYGAIDGGGNHCSYSYYPQIVCLP